MTDTRDTIRDGVRDTANAVSRNLPASNDNVSMITVILAIGAALLVGLYAFGAFGSSSTTRTVTETTTC